MSRYKQYTAKSGNAEWILTSKDETVFDLGRSKQAKINSLINFMRPRLEDRWTRIAKFQADFERQYFKELVSALKEEG